MSRVLSRWSPAVVRVAWRPAVLGVAGVALVGAALAGPGAALAAAPPGAAGAVAAASLVAAGAAPSSSTPSHPWEKALKPDFQFQPNYYYCDPAAARLAITAAGYAAPSQDQLARMLGTTTNGTDSSYDTTRVLNRVLGAGTYRTRSIPGNVATAAEIDRLKVDVVNAVSNGRAVVANIIGSATADGGRQLTYGGGHYLTVVGYGKGGTTLKIADPADTKGGGSYWMSTVNVANWIGTRGYSA